MFGESRMPTPEEMAEVQKNRTKSDAELLEKGAAYKLNEKNHQLVLEATQEQIDQAKEQMNKEFYNRYQEAMVGNYYLKKEVERAGGFCERTTINGTEIICEWDDHDRKYVLFLPQIQQVDKSFRISQNSKDAKKVFEFAAKLAKTGTNVSEILKESEQYWYSESEDNEK